MDKYIYNNSNAISSEKVGSMNRMMRNELRFFFQCFVCEIVG
jgi:hypothetical protein